MSAVFTGTTGAVTVTAPTVTGGTGISVSGSGTTSLTVSATGVQSLTAGTGISVSGTTTPTVTNSGVTSIVAGTNVTVSGATGAVTINAPGFATPGSSAIGDTAAAGTATTVARSDHVHGREAAGTPGASAVGDTASAGSATTVTRSDHRHSREAFGTPVAVDGQVTSLSTGSLTSVARADHVHTLSNAFRVLASTTTSSNATSIVFSNIPQTYKTLLLVWQGRASAAVTLTGIVAQYNGDTAANYDNGYGANRSNLHVAFSTGASTYWASATGTGVMVIHDYAQTTFYKSSFSFGGSSNNSTSTYSHAGMSTHGQWRSTAAITSITLIVESGGYFVNGSSAALLAS